MHTGIAIAVLLASALAGCAGIPELAFEPDASADGSQSTVDANVASDGRIDEDALEDGGRDHDAVDAEPADAGALDANDTDGSAADSPYGDAQDGSAPDAALADAGKGDDGGITCPAGPPPGASICCKTVPCHGAQSSCHSECVNCQNNCAGQTCCLDSNGNYHGCAKSPADCPL